MSSTANAARPDSAQAALRAALDLRAGLFGLADPRTGSTYQALGAARRDAGALAEAEALLDTAVTIFAGAGDDRRAASALEELADVKWFAGDLEAAQELFERSILLNAALFGEDDIRVASTRQGLSILYNETGQPQRALPLVESALSTFARLGTPPNELSSIRATLAQVLDSLGRVDEAESHYRRQLQEVEASLPSGHQRIATSQIYLGTFLCRRGHALEGGELLAAALANWTTTLGPDHGATHRARAWLGYCRGRAGDLPAARALLDEALRALKPLDEQGAVNPAWVTQAEQWLEELGRNEDPPRDGAASRTDLGGPSDPDRRSIDHGGS